MKTKFTFILVFFLIFISNVILAKSSSKAEVTALSYRYNLLELPVYIADSGFDAVSPVSRLWDGITSVGVNDSKATGNVEAWVEFDFGREYEIEEAKLFQDHGGNRVTSWKVMYWTGDKWEDVFPYLNTTASGWQSKTFDKKARKVRFYARCSASSSYVSIHEIELYTKTLSEPQKIMVGCVGDSNTEGAGASFKSLYSWPVQLGMLMGLDYQVKNCGKSGTTLQNAADLPWTADAQYTVHKGINSNISIIALGTNDSKSYNWNSNRFKSDYINLIKEFQGYESKPEIFILVPIKSYSTTSTIRNQVIKDEIRPILRDISRDYGIAVIDGYVVTENIGDLVPDGIHPNDEGLKMIAEKVASVLKTTKPLITINGNPSSITYAQYRWYKDGVLISGASASNYTVTQPGIYKVAVKLNSTTDDVIVSKDYEVLDAGVKLVISDGISSSISTSEIKQVRVSKINNEISVKNAAGLDLRLYDVYGKQLKIVKIQNSNENINISHLPCGIYLYRVGEISGKILK